MRDTSALLALIAWVSRRLAMSLSMLNFISISPRVQGPDGQKWQSQSSLTAGCVKSRYFDQPLHDHASLSMNWLMKTCL